MEIQASLYIYNSVRLWWEFQEPLEGKIIVKSSSSISHYGVRLIVNGSVNLQVGLNQSSVWFPKKNNEKYCF